MQSKETHRKKIVFENNKKPTKYTNARKKK